MKKIDRRNYKYLMIIAILILFTIYIVGITLSGDVSDGEIVEHEKLSVVPKKGSASGNDEISEKTDESNKTKDIEKVDKFSKTEEPELSFESDISGNQDTIQETGSTEEEIFDWYEAERYLEQEVPELAVYDHFINVQSEGKAYLVVDTDIRADELYGNNQEFLGNYYTIYVGEKWEDHMANWYWFHVREDLKEILWCEIVECEYYSLEEWRDSLEYKEQMERLTEYLEENEDTEYVCKNPYFYAQSEEKKRTVEYEGYFYLHTYSDIWQNARLDIVELETFENGILYTLELEQLDVDDPLDELGWGRQYVGYFYVTDDAVYYRSTATMDGYNNKEKREIIRMIKTDEKEFCEKESCIVCCEDGTSDITDELGYHAFVEVKGDRRVFRYYNDYYFGSKDYMLMEWEKGKGLVYYIHGNGGKNMHVEFGENIKEKQEESYGNPFDMRKGPRKEPFYGTWYIEKVAMTSETYTGTALDGVAEEDLYDPEDFLGYELEYTNEYFRIGDKKYEVLTYLTRYKTIEKYQEEGKFRPELYTFTEEEGIKIHKEEEYGADTDLMIFSVDFFDEVSYGEYDFIPVGTECVLLNEDTMLMFVGASGKVLLARRI